MLRHGMTEANERRVFTGATDVPLSGRGRAELEARKGRFPAASAFFTSGMLRTRQTLAVLYGDVAGIDIPDLAEYRFGDFEGRGHNELYERESVYREWLDRERDDIVCPGGESRAEFRSRLAEGWQALAAYDWEGLAVLVTHGGVIATLMDVPTPGNGCGVRVRLAQDGTIMAQEAFS